MKKVRLLILVVSFIMTITACALIEKDDNVDKATPIITIDDIIYTKGQVIQTAEQLAYNYNNYYYYYYGQVSNATASSFIETAVEELKKEAVERYMVRLLKIDQLTEDDQILLEQQIEADKQSQLDAIRSYYFNNSELEEDEINKLVLELYNAAGNMDTLISESSTLTFLKDRLRASITDLVTVTEDEARTNFNALVEEAKEKYVTNLSSFGISYNAGSQVYYTPEGYRYIMSLVVKYTDEDSSAIKDLKAQISEKETLVKSLQQAISEIEGTVELTESERNELEKSSFDLASAQDDMTTLNEQLNQLLDTAHRHITPRIEEIRSRYLEGEQFVDLMAEFGSDNNHINTTTGYAICDGFTGKDTLMVNASMALMHPGDITTEDISVSTGIQILCFSGIAQEGETDFETVKDLDAVTKLSAKKDETYDAQLLVWISENPVKVDMRPLRDVK